MPVLSWNPKAPARDPRPKVSKETQSLQNKFHVQTLNFVQFERVKNPSYCSIRKLFNTSFVWRNALLKALLLTGFIAILPCHDAFADADSDASLPPVAKSADTAHPIGVGAMVPGGTLQTLEGKPYDFLTNIHKKPSILIFYRGGWCPYCNVQMEQLIKLEPRLTALGYQILAISPDSPASQRESLKKHQITYTLLSDSPMILTRKFGLAWHLNGMNNLLYRAFGVDLKKASGQSHLFLPVPAAYVVDTMGQIKYLFYDPNYSKRVDPEELYHAAESALTVPKP